MISLCLLLLALQFSAAEWIPRCYVLHAENVSRSPRDCSRGTERIPCPARRVGVAPDPETGAWKLVPEYMYYLHQDLADRLIHLFNGGSVLELGAGLGCYTEYLTRNGRGLRVSGYDGAVNVGEITEGLIQHADLTKPHNFGKHDWVFCMEVAEHIPEQFEITMVQNWVRHARKGLVISWGRHGQGGNGHVNLRSPEYVKAILFIQGFEYDAETTAWLSSNIGYWLQPNLMVLRKVL